MTTHRFRKQCRCSTTGNHNQKQVLRTASPWLKERSQQDTHTQRGSVSFPSSCIHFFYCYVQTACILLGSVSDVQHSKRLCGGSRDTDRRHGDWQSQREKLGRLIREGLPGGGEGEIGGGCIKARQAGDAKQGGREMEDRKRGNKPKNSLVPRWHTLCQGATGCGPKERLPGRGATF